MNVAVRVPCFAGSAWNSGACRTVKFSSNDAQLGGLGADEHVAHEQRVPRVGRDVADAQPMRRIGAGIQVLDEQIGGRSTGRRARRRAARRSAAGQRLVHRAPIDVRRPTRPSRTTNLSLGERPVCGDVTAANGPWAARCPSPRRTASSTSAGPSGSSAWSHGAQSPAASSRVVARGGRGPGAPAAGSR